MAGSHQTKTDDPIYSLRLGTPKQWDLLSNRHAQDFITEILKIESSIGLYYKPG